MLEQYSMPMCQANPIFFVLIYKLAMVMKWPLMFEREKKNKQMKYFFAIVENIVTRASFEEQKTANWMLFDGGGELANGKDIAPPDKFKSWVPSLIRLFFDSKMNFKSYASIFSKSISTFCIPFFTRWWYNHGFLIEKSYVLNSSTQSK